MRFADLVPLGAEGTYASPNLDGRGGGGPKKPGRYNPALLGGLLRGSWRGLESSLIGASTSESRSNIGTSILYVSLVSFFSVKQTKQAVMTSWSVGAKAEVI